MAEGYQINSLSTKQIGMGHTGVALKLGAENMYFNPAGMAYMDKTLDLNGSFTGIMPTATATVNGKSYETDNGVSTPISVNAAFSIYPNLKGGIAFYTPLWLVNQLDRQLARSRALAERIAQDFHHPTYPRMGHQRQILNRCRTHGDMGQR